MNARIIPTMSWPCDADGAVSAYLDRGDREDASAEFEAQVALSLRVQFMAAMAAGEGEIPFVRRRLFGLPDTEQAESLHDAVMVLLESDAVKPLLADLLAHSECPIARVLRVVMTNQLVIDRASELAEIRRGDAA